MIRHLGATLFGSGLTCAPWIDGVSSAFAFIVVKTVQPSVCPSVSPLKREVPRKKSLLLMDQSHVYMLGSIRFLCLTNLTNHKSKKKAAAAPTLSSPKGMLKPFWLLLPFVHLNMGLLIHILHCPETAVSFLFSCLMLYSTNLQLVFYFTPFKSCLHTLVLALLVLHFPCQETPGLLLLLKSWRSCAWSWFGTGPCRGLYTHHSGVHLTRPHSPCVRHTHSPSGCTSRRCTWTAAAGGRQAGSDLQHLKHMQTVHC